MTLAAITGGLLLWLLGAVLFFWAAEDSADCSPGLDISKDWRNRSLRSRAAISLAWWLLVLWQLAEETHRRRRR